MSEAKRGSGRTRRMFDDALKLVARGLPVYVVVAHEGHASFLRCRLPHIPGTLKILWLGDTSLNWPLVWPFPGDRPRVRGAPPNCVVFVDHSAAELRASWLRRELAAAEALALKWDA